MFFPFMRTAKKKLKKLSSSDPRGETNFNGVARKDVIGCYRLFLGREPESEAAVLEYMKTKDLSTLRNIFIGSAEFRDRVQSSDLVQLPFLPLDLPKNTIEYDATPAQLVACVAKIKKVWSHLGETKPHFSVLTHADFLPENLAENLDAFWSSGEGEAANLAKMLNRYGFRDLADKVCVEYGCGVGRVSIGLAQRFSQIHCYDISPGHLSLATQRAQDVGATDLQTHLCTENPLDPLEKCDFFFSRIVFQHNPPPVIFQLFKNALQSLNREGVAIIQVPTYRIDYTYNIREWLAAGDKLDMEMHCLPQHAIYSLISSEGCELLEVREDGFTGYSHQFVSNTFVVWKRG